MALQKVDWLVGYLDLASKQAGYRLLREGGVPEWCIVRLSPRRVRVIEEAVRSHFEQPDGRRHEPELRSNGDAIA